MESKRLKTVIKRPTVYHGVVTDYSKRENLDTPNRQDVVLTIDISKSSQQAYLDIPISTESYPLTVVLQGDW
mgnify:FL=1